MLIVLNTNQIPKIRSDHSYNRIIEHFVAHRVKGEVHTAKLNELTRLLNSLSYKFDNQIK